MARPQPLTEPAPRGRGRPAIGRPTLVKLSEDDREFALTLGRGVLADGIREALRMARERVEAAPLTSATR